VADGGNTAFTPSHTYNHAFCIFPSEVVQNGVGICHLECRTVFYHEISGKRESETSWNSLQVKRASEFDWCNKFSEDSEHAASWPYDYVQATGARDVNIYCVQELILGKRWIKVHDCIQSFGRVQTIYLWTLIVQDSVFLVGPKDADNQPEETCFCVCQSSEPGWIVGKDISEAMWLVTRHGYTTSLQNQRDPV
jgi:hypothetical protein